MPEKHDFLAPPERAAMERAFQGANFSTNILSKKCRNFGESYTSEESGSRILGNSIEGSSSCCRNQSFGQSSGRNWRRTARSTVGLYLRVADGKPWFEAQVAHDNLGRGFLSAIHVPMPWLRGNPVSGRRGIGHSWNDSISRTSADDGASWQPDDIQRSARRPEGLCRH